MSDLLKEIAKTSQHGAALSQPIPFRFHSLHQHSTQLEQLSKDLRWREFADFKLRGRPEAGDTRGRREGKGLEKGSG